MILLNPVDGSEIKNIYKDNVLYFDEKKGEQFKVDSLVSIDDGVGNFIVTLCEFVKILTKDEAVKYLEDKKNVKYICECGIKFGAEKPYLEHKKSHETRVEDELGIPVIKGEGQSEKVEDTQNAIDSDLSREGITGEGLRIENNEVKARF